MKLQVQPHLRVASGFVAFLFAAALAFYVPSLVLSQDTQPPPASRVSIVRPFATRLAGSTSVVTTASASPGPRARDAVGVRERDVTNRSRVRTTHSNYVAAAAPEERRLVIAAPLRVVATVGQPVTIIVIAADAGPDTIANLTAATSGFAAAFATNAAHSQGTLTWTPGPEFAGRTHLVTFTASNARSASVVTTIEVGPSPARAPSPVTLDSPMLSVADDENVALLYPDE